MKEVKVKLSVPAGWNVPKSLEMFSLLNQSFEELREYLKEREESNGCVSDEVSKKFKEFVSGTLYKTIYEWLNYENYRRQVACTIGLRRVTVYLTDLMSGYVMYLKELYVLMLEVEIITEEQKDCLDSYIEGKTSWGDLERGFRK